MTKIILFVGPEKTGTSWIDQYLRNVTPQYLSKFTKETFFFDRHYEKGLNWYLSKFDNSDRIVEVAPSYFSGDIAGRIKKHFDEIEIVITLRNPVDRTRSLIKHMWRYGWSNKEWRAVCRDYPFILQGSMYSKRINYWKDSFPEGKITILYYDELRDDSSEFAKKISKIIGVNYDVNSASSLGMVNSSQAGRHYYLSILARKASTIIRSLGWDGVIHYMKLIGIKNLVYGGSWDGGAHEEKMKGWSDLNDILSEEVEYFEKLREKYFAES